jgi:hypothetical protein
MSYRMRSCMIVLVPLLMLSSLAPSNSEASVTIRNIPPTPHLAPAETSLADLSAAIKFAVVEEGWSAIAEAPGVIRASLRVRTHKAVVTIGFDESNFWIEYRDSMNLDYNPKNRRATRTRREIKGPRIHRNYNLWIKSLAKSIELYASTPPKSYLTDTAPSETPILIADELEKLDALRERGILTQEEFDQQKAKLLAQ